MKNIFIGSILMIGLLATTSASAAITYVNVVRDGNGWLNSEWKNECSGGYALEGPIGMPTQDIDKIILVHEQQAGESYSSRNWKWYSPTQNQYYDTCDYEGTWWMGSVPAHGCMEDDGLWNADYDTTQYLDRWGALYLDGWLSGVYYPYTNLNTCSS